ncbi:hypothetical protein M409DRAFT_69656 [Zasmidium cellare ATCC 36951]|uniref:Uncharacterized protein n=1 Tax=Zasmidium cellare ATCC 36951 TaxID=1080233 RepID=A0A6A6C6N2_ZASCE|nr:uncharacterized protein M409DRAFT_69656 [Zasmidium cellare ATCC 36951]KAF2161542.1 hypothetical protein M409DRAFT_69656 [Zasmidium cellare ATCC 36951]
MDSAMENDYPAPPSMGDANFDILEWHPAYLSCQRYFIDHAQHEPATQAVCALTNIRLPFQWLGNPVTASTPPQSSQGGNFNFNAYQRQGSNYQSPQGRGNNDRPTNFVSPVPYIRRLVVTGFDKPAILHGFFGDDYLKGVMPHVECERRNYLFAAKHGGWRTCKKQYDSGSGGGHDETLPFMKPLDEAKMEELTAAEKAWSSWLAMEDWMVGPRAPEDEDAPRTHSHRASGGGSMRYQGMPDGMPDGLTDNSFSAGGGEDMRYGRRDGGMGDGGLPDGV